MIKKAILACAGGVFATAVLAHEGVQNQAVLARMQSMSQIAEETKLLGQMAKGQVSFDASAARMAVARIAEQADETARLFARPEMDPKSEALPVIWDRFDHFVSIADELQTAASEAAGYIDTEVELRTALARIGGTCRSCHADYRE